MGVAATLHFLGPKGTPGGTRAYTRELEDYVTPCGRLAAGARGTGGGSRPTHGLGGGCHKSQCTAQKITVTIQKENNATHHT